MSAHLGDEAAPPAALYLEPDPAAVRRAREFVAAACRRAGIAEDTCDTAVLLASEVVTNAFLHGRSRARVSVSASSRLVQVEVGDENSRHPAPLDADDAALDGRGMAIVELLATSWGVRDEEYGKTVWFTLLHP